MKKGKEEDNLINKKWISIVGFIISIILLTVAIILSANEEKTVRESKVKSNQLTITQVNDIEQASSSLQKEIDENNIGQGITQEVSNPDLNSQNETNEESIEQNDTNIEHAIENIQQTSDNQEQNNQTDENNNQISTEENSVKQQFIKPVEGENITNFSMDSLIYSNTLQEWITHRGIDIKAEKTTVVKASADGKVKSIKEDPRYGLSITIEHSGGFQTVYSCLLSSEFVKEGDTVTQGQSIGTVGNSAVFESSDGSHLHFEILKDGEYVNPDIYVK